MVEPLKYTEKDKSEFHLAELAGLQFKQRPERRFASIFLTRLAWRAKLPARAVVK
jgi:hypothetical protein